MRNGGTYGLTCNFWRIGNWKHWKHCVLLVLPHRPGGDQRGALPYLYPARLPWRPTAAKLKRAPAPPAPPTSSSHVPLRTQALRKPLSLKDKSFQKKMVGPCGAGRRSARSKTFQPVNATYVALTRRTAPRWPPGQKNFPTRGAYAPSRESGGSPSPSPCRGGKDPQSVLVARCWIPLSAL